MSLAMRRVGFKTLVQGRRFASFQGRRFHIHIPNNGFPIHQLVAPSSTALSIPLQSRFTTTNSSAAADDDNDGPSKEDERMLAMIMEYKEVHGDCHVPAGNSRINRDERLKFGISDEFSRWIVKQRKKYQISRTGKGSKFSKNFQIHVLFLETMGFMWSEREAGWQRNFNRLEHHIKSHNGRSEVDREENLHLASWVDQQRRAYKSDKMSLEREQLLHEVGFHFDPHVARWNENLDKLCRYREEHGDAMVPAEYDEDPSFGSWISRQRRIHSDGELPEHRIQALEEVGFSWDLHQDTWNRFYEQLRAFHAKHGHTRVPRSEGSLWMWSDRQRIRFKGLLRKQQDVDQSSSSDEEQLSALDRLGFDFTAGDQEAAERVKQLRDLTFRIDVFEEEWWNHYKKLCDYKERFAHAAPIPAAGSQEDRELREWVNRQRLAYKNDKLPKERIRALEDIGIAWTSRRGRWDRSFAGLREFHAEHGHCRVPTSDSSLHKWVSEQRKIFQPFLDHPDTLEGESQEIQEIFLELKQIDFQF
jgi:hypothetical protein